MSSCKERYCHRGVFPGIVFSAALDFQLPHSWALLPCIAVYMNHVEQDWDPRTDIMGKGTLALLDLLVSFLGSWVRKAPRWLLSMGSMQFLLGNDL